jgi:hypothetical protein
MGVFPAGLIEGRTNRRKDRKPIENVLAIRSILSSGSVSNRELSYFIIWSDFITCQILYFLL